MPYTRFAVLGTGNVGLPVIEGLLAKNAYVLVIVRPSSTKSLPSGAKVAEVDISDVPATAAILKEHSIEVFISTVGTNLAVLESQKALGDAAKQAGVQLFVPSEYGVPSENATIGRAGVKYGVNQYITSLGLPTARFFTGFFMEFITHVTAFKFNGKINITGSGDVPISFTAQDDATGFIVHVLSTLEPSQLANKIFRLEGQRATLNQLGEIFAGKAPLSKADTMPGPLGPDLQYMMTSFDSGVGSTGWDILAKKEGTEKAGSSNYLWEGHHWKTIKETLDL